MATNREQKLRLQRLPNILCSTFLGCSKREKKGQKSVAIGNHCKVLPKQRAGEVQKQKKNEVKGRSALRIVADVNCSTARLGVKTLESTETRATAASNKLHIILPTDSHAAPSVLGLRPVRKTLVMPIPQQKENINNSDAHLNQMFVADSGLKMKQVHSCTSDLSVCSKFASGISKKPNREIDEIDLSDVNNQLACNISENSLREIDEIDLPDINNQLAVVEYVQDLYNFYQQQQHVYRPIDYTDKQLHTDQQPHIKPNTRAMLVDWIIEVHYVYKLMPETLYLTIHIFDRYLSQEAIAITRKQLKLVGMAAMLIASKYEEIYPPQVNDFIEIASSAYTKEEILGMEKMILDKLEWYLTIPTTYMFLVRYIKAAKADQELEHMIYFFAELGLMLHDLIKYCSSMVAASAVYTACCTLGKTPLWTDALERHTSFSECQLLECAQVLVRAHWAVPSSKLKVVYQKYMLPEFGSVARYPPAMSLIELSEPDAPSESS